MKVHYICHYNDPFGLRDLVTQPSGTTKINYIKSCLKKAGYYVSIYCVSEATQQKLVYYKAAKYKIDLNEEISFINSFGRTNLFLKIASRLYMQLQVILHIIFNIKPEDIVVVYHSMGLRWPLIIARKILNRKIILEVEELYSAAWQLRKDQINKEKKYFRNIADSYILVNDIIAKKCSLSKPFVVCYGNYEKNPNVNNFEEDNLTHIVYAGVISEEGTDAFIASETITFLPKNYRIHILGYGTNSHINKLETKIDSINKFLGYKGVTYEGCLSGHEYTLFLSKCSIGLCTRVLKDDLSDYTFPSKILVYLGNGLIPICSPITSVMQSQVKDYVVFTEEITPESVANAILSINKKSYSSPIVKLDLLDKNFVQSLDSLLKSLL